MNCKCIAEAEEQARKRFMESDIDHMLITSVMTQRPHVTVAFVQSGIFGRIKHRQRNYPVDMKYCPICGKERF